MGFQQADILRIAMHMLIAAMVKMETIAHELRWGLVNVHHFRYYL